MEQVPVVNLTPEFLLAAVGALTAIVFNFFPKLNTWFASKPSAYKQGFMALLGLVVAFAVFGLGCAELLQTNTTCTLTGAMSILYMFIAWIIGNQSADRAFAKPKAVLAAKNQEG